MPIQHINYDLPEFAFLEATCHLGNPLEGRDVIIHIRSHTIIEAIALDEVLMSDFGGEAKYEFEYINIDGAKEKYLLAVHYSIAGEFELDEILRKTASWYSDYMTWEDSHDEDDF